jgi:hypothetical protein
MPLAVIGVRAIFLFRRSALLTLGVGLPDGGWLAYNSKLTMTPLRAIWATTFLSEC